jgi:hypothetical protein
MYSICCARGVLFTALPLVCCALLSQLNVSPQVVVVGAFFEAALQLEVALTASSWPGHHPPVAPSYSTISPTVVGPVPLQSEPSPYNPYAQSTRSSLQPLSQSASAMGPPREHFSGYPPPPQSLREGITHDSDESHVHCSTKQPSNANSGSKTNSSSS